MGFSLSRRSLLRLSDPQASRVSIDLDRNPGGAGASRYLAINLGEVSDARARRFAGVAHEQPLPKTIAPGFMGKIMAGLSWGWGDTLAAPAEPGCGKSLWPGIAAQGWRGVDWLGAVAK